MNGPQHVNIILSISQSPTNHKPGMVGVKGLSHTTGNRGLMRLFWIFLLISLYVVFFGINSFERFNEEAIVVIIENLVFSSIDFNPGGNRFLLNISTQSELYLYLRRYRNPSCRSYQW